MGLMGSAEELEEPYTEREKLISVRAEQIMETLCAQIQVNVLDEFVETIREQYNRTVPELRPAQIEAERQKLLMTVEGAYQNELARKGDRAKIERLREWADQLTQPPED